MRPAPASPPKPGLWRRVVPAALLLLAACASTVADFQEVPQPVAGPEVGHVVLFTGLNWSGESHRATGTDALAQLIRGEGVPATLYRPGEWEQAAQDVLQRAPRPAVIAVYGYSAGSSAAARFARRLEEAGIPVETMLLLEAWNPTEVPCGVRLAVQYRLEAGSPLSPARPGCTALRDRLIDASWVARGVLGHLSVAVDPDVLQLLRRELVQDGRVRRQGHPDDAARRDGISPAAGHP
ncbi:thioesterase domain-containing protein, partial [Teichococcus deserti]|uniref:thioesterase domain-containing protein n=1 Tax=Teichococcus deserti TaxID=1817963 RepID=UPI001A960F08